jgi:hypothetical protein
MAGILNAALSLDPPNVSIVWVWVWVCDFFIEYTKYTVRMMRTAHTTIDTTI